MPGPINGHLEPMRPKMDKKQHVFTFFIFKARYRALDEYMKALTGEAFLWMIGILCFSSFIYGMLAMKFSMPPVELALVLPVVFGGHGLILHLLVWKDNG